MPRCGCCTRSWPFLTEELWHQLPQQAGAKSIALDQFPEAHDHWKNARALEEVDGIQEVVAALRNIRAELKLDPKKREWRTSHE